MLVLRRKIGQKIIIVVKPSEAPQRIEIMLTDVSAWHAQIGVEAGEAVRILRGELDELETVE